MQLNKHILATNRIGSRHIISLNIPYVLHSCSSYQCKIGDIRCVYFIHVKLQTTHGTEIARGALAVAALTISTVASVNIATAATVATEITAIPTGVFTQEASVGIGQLLTKVAARPGT